MALDMNRLMRVVTITLAGCVAFFGTWMFLDARFSAPTEDILAVAVRAGIAGLAAGAAVGLSFLAARFCWPILGDDFAGTSESA